MHFALLNWDTLWIWCGCFRVWRKRWGCEAADLTSQLWSKNRKMQPAPGFFPQNITSLHFHKQVFLNLALKRRRCTVQPSPVWDICWRRAEAKKYVDANLPTLLFNQLSQKQKWLLFSYSINLRQKAISADDEINQNQTLSQSIISLSCSSVFPLLCLSIEMFYTGGGGGAQGGSRPILVSIGGQFEVLQGCKRRTCRVKLLAGDHS